jgi:TRAP-type C4-dicarboxylate transport system permease small subunit
MSNASGKPFWQARADEAMDRVTAVAAFTGAIAIAVIMVLTTSDVGRRYLSGGGIHGIVENVEVLIAFAAFLGLAQAQRLGMHVSTSVATDRMPETARRIVQLCGHLAFTGFVAALTYAAGARAWESYKVREYRFGLAETPIWPGRAAFFVGCLLLLTVVLLQLAVLVSALRGDGAERLPAQSTDPAEAEKGVL